MASTKYIVPFGVLKIIEFFTLLVAWSTVVNQYNKDEHDYIFTNNRSKPAFHVTICIIGWIYTLFMLILNLAGACAKIKIPKKNTVNGVLHMILGVLVLIAGALVADLFSSHDGYHTFKAGAAFGIISAIILIIDAVLYVCKGPPDEE